MPSSRSYPNPHQRDPNAEASAKVNQFLTSDDFKKYQETDVYKRILEVVKDVPSARRDLRISEVAERLRVSDSFARKLCDTGELKSYKIGKERRVSECDLLNYLEKRREEAEQHLQELVNDSQDMDVY